MRTPLPFCLFFMPSAILAQVPAEVADQRTDQVTYTGLVPLGDSLWAVTGWANMEGGFWQEGGYFVSGINSAGEVVWTIQEPVVASSFSNFPTGLAAASDSTVLVAGMVDGCDVLSSMSAVLLVHRNGQVIWNRMLDLFPEFDWLTQVAAGPDTVYATASPQRVFLLSAQGDSLSSWTSPVQPIQRLVWQNDSVLLIAADTVLAQVLTDGSVIATSPLSSAGRDLRVDDDAILVLQDDSVHVFDLSLAPINGYALTAFAGSVQQFVPNGTAVAVLTDSSLIALDNLYSPVSSMDLSGLPGHFVGAGAIQDGALMTAGIAQAHGRSAGVARSYLLDGSVAEHADDVEILVHVDSAWFQFSGMSGNYAIYTQYASATVRIVNHGIADLDHILVNYRPTNALGYCGPAGQTVVAVDMQLAPGDTVEVDMPNLWLNMGPSTPGSSATMNICVVAESPNLQVDRDPSDNLGCQSVTYMNTVGIAERNTIDDLMVYPNPCTDLIRVRLDEQGGTWSFTLRDAQGRTVRTGRIANTAGNDATIELPGVRAGAYVLALESERTLRTARITVLGAN